MSQELVSTKARKIAIFYQMKAAVFVATEITSWIKALKNVLKSKTLRRSLTVISNWLPLNVHYVKNISFWTNNPCVNQWRSTFRDVRFTPNKSVLFATTTKSFILRRKDASIIREPNNVLHILTWVVNHVIQDMLWTPILSSIQLKI